MTIFLPNSTSSLIRYLDKVRHLYPGAVPLEIFERSSSAATKSVTTTPSNAAVPVMFFLAVQGPGLSPSQTELMESIITKGLMLTASEVPMEICAISSNFPTDELVKGRISELKPRIAILMGFPTMQIGEWGELDDVQVLCTRALDDVAESRDAKREFWGHLKIVLSRLSSL